MADAPDYYGDAMKSNDQMIGALQQANANYKPQGIFANVDPTMLSLAQGLLAPTKTGGFGESISNAAGAVAGPLAAMKQAQLTNLEKIATLKNAQARLAMEAPYYQARGDYYGARADTFGGVGAGNLSPLDIQRINRNIESLNFQMLGEKDPTKKIMYQSQIDAMRKQVNGALGVESDASSISAAPPAPAGAPLTPGNAHERTWGEFFSGQPSYVPNAQPPASSTAAPAAPKQNPAQQPDAIDQSSTPKQKPAQQPDATDQSSTLTVGSTKQVKVGKDNLTATYAPDGKWYVVKDGKHYPVVE